MRPCRNDPGLVCSSQRRISAATQPARVADPPRRVCYLHGLLANRAGAICFDVLWDNPWPYRAAKSVLVKRGDASIRRPLMAPSGRSAALVRRSAQGGSSGHDCKAAQRPLLTLSGPMPGIEVMDRHRRYCHLPLRAASINSATVICFGNEKSFS